MRRAPCRDPRGTRVAMPALCNTLHPLKVGLHALGSGKTQEAYGNAMGLSQPSINIRIKAARVAKITRVIDPNRWRHLAELHMRRSGCGQRCWRPGTIIGGRTPAAACLALCRLAALRPAAGQASLRRRSARRETTRPRATTSRAARYICANNGCRRCRQAIVAAYLRDRGRNDLLLSPSNRPSHTK